MSVIANRYVKSVNRKLKSSASLRDLMAIGAETLISVLRLLGVVADTRTSNTASRTKLRIFQAYMCTGSDAVLAPISAQQERKNLAGKMPEFRMSITVGPAES